MGVAGWVLFALGVVSIIIGLVTGAKDLFKRQNEGEAQAGLPQKFFEVLLKLLEAPPAKFFTVFGLLLVVIGLGLTGTEVFS